MKYILALVLSIFLFGCQSQKHELIYLKSNDPQILSKKPYVLLNETKEWIEVCQRDGFDQTWFFSSFGTCESPAFYNSSMWTIKHTGVYI